MMASLSPEEQEQFDALKLNNLNDLQSYISNNSGALSGKLSEAVKKVLANITLSSSIEYDQAKQFISNYSYFMDRQRRLSQLMCLAQGHTPPSWE